MTKKIESGTNLPHSHRGVRTAWLLLILACFRIYAGDTRTRVLSLLTTQNYAAGAVGAALYDLEKDSLVFGLNADTHYIPASVSKLVSGAAAFERLRVTHRFPTKVYTSAPLDSDSGLVAGDLWIRGEGDPGFLAERLWLFVQHLRHKGLRRITGDVVLDDSFFDTRISGPGYAADASSRAYQAPVGALSASFNCVAVHVRPGSRPGSPVHVDVFPELDGIKLENTAKTVAPGKSSGIQVKTEKIDDRTGVLVFGSMSAGGKPRYIYRKVWQTWQNFGAALSAQFSRYDISVDGAVRHGTLPDSLAALPPLYTFDSRPLSEFVRHMFKYSSNFAAEMVFKSLSATDSTAGSWEKSSEVVTQWWKANQLPGSPTIRNGSGMGKANQLSPREVTGLLRHVWNHKDYLPEYLACLSTAGRDGTLDDRFSGSPLEGIVRAKTGTLNDYGASTLAGYVLLPHKTCAFAILVNSRKNPQYTHWTVQEKILEVLVESLGK